MYTTSKQLNDRFNKMQDQQNPKRQTKRKSAHNNGGRPAALRFGTFPKPKRTVIYGVSAPKGYFGRLVKLAKKT